MNMPFGGWHVTEGDSYLHIIISPLLLPPSEMSQRRNNPTGCTELSKQVEQAPQDQKNPLTSLPVLRSFKDVCLMAEFIPNIALYVTI